MASTTITGVQILDGSVGRVDVDTTTTGQAVITKVIAGTNVTLSYTGVDAGTGDVTVNFTGGGGSTGSNQQVVWQSKQLTGTYATGGVVIPLGASLASINWASVTIEALGGLPGLRCEYAYSAGTVTVKLMMKKYTRLSTLTGVTGQPSGVTVRATSGFTSSSEAAHIHSIDHDHPSFTTGAASTGVGQVLLDAAGPSTSLHTHSVNYPNLVANSGAGTSHNHVDNTIYDHGHSLTQVATSMDALTQMANGTSLTGVVLNVLAFGISV